MQSTTSHLKHNPSWQFEAIGTHWSIETDEPLTNDVQIMITNCISLFDKTYSRFRDDSIVTEMTKRAGMFELPTDDKELARIYRQLYEATSGAMTPLVGEGLVAAGYDSNYSLLPTTPLPAPVWDDVLQWRGRIVQTAHPVVLDIGAAGKGYLVDMVGSILESAGIMKYIIDASGDIRHRGADMQVIGLENPTDPTMVIGTMSLQNASLCASASNRRKWGDGWHHVLDARTGQPIREVIATWVRADSTMIADGLATALFFAAGDTLQHVGQFDYVRLFANGKVEHSQDFVGELFI